MGPPHLIWVNNVIMYEYYYIRVDSGEDVRKVNVSTED